MCAPQRALQASRCRLLRAVWGAPGCREIREVWAKENIMGRSKQKGLILQPSCKEVANRVVRAIGAITNDALREACRTASCPSGLKLSHLEDTEFLRKRNSSSDSDDGSQADTDDSIDSDGSSGADDSHSDNGGHNDVIWAKVGHGVQGCAMFSRTPHTQTAI